MQIFQKFVISGKCNWSWKIEHSEMGVFENGQKGVKRAFRVACTRIPFSDEYPPTACAPIDDYWYKCLRFDTGFKHFTSNSLIDNINSLLEKKKKKTETFNIPLCEKMLCWLF